MTSAAGCFCRRRAAAESGGVSSVGSLPAAPSPDLALVWDGGAPLRAGARVKPGARRPLARFLARGGASLDWRDERLLPRGGGQPPCTCWSADPTGGAPARPDAATVPPPPVAAPPRAALTGNRGLSATTRGCDGLSRRAIRCHWLSPRSRCWAAPAAGNPIAAIEPPAGPCGTAAPATATLPLRRAFRRRLPPRLPVNSVMSCRRPAC